MKLKKVLFATLALALGLNLAACQKAVKNTGTEKKTETSAQTKVKATDSKSGVETVTLKIAASATPHADILKYAQGVLDASSTNKRVKLDIKVFEDYVLPNKVTEDGTVDVNYFQHEPFLKDFNEKNGTHIVTLKKIHYEPFGLFGGKQKSLDNLKDGATIAVPNDGTNEGRALRLLESAGLIKLKQDAGFNLTKQDIVENPHKLKIEEVEAAQVPKVLPDVDYGVINGNFALLANLNVSKDALLVEKSKDAINEFANLLAVKKGNENLPGLKELVEALNSKTVRDYVDEKYKGSVIMLDK